MSFNSFIHFVLSPNEENTRTRVVALAMRGVLAPGWVLALTILGDHESFAESNCAPFDLPDADGEYGAMGFAEYSPSGKQQLRSIPTPDFVRTLRTG